MATAKQSFSVGVLAGLSLAFLMSGLVPLLAGSSSTSKPGDDGKATQDKKGEEGEASVILALIRKRRSVFPKDYTGKQVDASKLNAILEACRHAPSHKMTEPWFYHVFSGLGKDRLGAFLAELYRVEAKDSFSAKKFQAKIDNMTRSSHCVAIIVDRKANAKVPEWEEVCSVACSVHNMHLTATALGVGMYWSSSGVIFEEEGRDDRRVNNPPALKTFLGLSDTAFCMGWLFVGDVEPGKWPPTGKRKEICEKVQFHSE